MRVSELSGAMLDYWVARAEGIEHPPYLRKMSPNCCLVPRDTIDKDDGCHARNWVAFEPSTDWAVGGPIIEREEISLEPHANYKPNDTSDMWDATIFFSGGCQDTKEGDTPLIAAMRAYVASKFGDDVSDEVS